MTQINRHTTVFHNDFIYLFGGADSEIRTNELFAFNISNKSRFLTDVKREEKVEEVRSI